MSYEYLIFDLDGTISDPKEGIVKSLNYALLNHGFDPQDEDSLAQYIGPPLDSAFKHITQLNDGALIASLVAKYRERYSQIGYSENVIYNGIEGVLGELSKIPDITLGVCTSKRADFAERILTMFGIRQHFKFVDGGDVGIAKWQQLAALLENKQISPSAVMIGDRAVDITAGQENGLATAGVLWGYGSRTELDSATPDQLFYTPESLLGLVQSH